MLYTVNNARGADVIDMDTGSRIPRVLEVKPEQGWIKVSHSPPRLDAQGRIAAERIHFRSIYVIQGQESRPCLFHCYGRLQ